MTDSNCRDVETRLAEIVDGEPDALAALGEHLDACAACSGKVEQARRASAWLRKAGDRGGPLDLRVERLLGRADEMRRARRSRMIGLVGGGLALAASIAAVALVLRGAEGGDEGAVPGPLPAVAAADAASGPAAPEPGPADRSVAGPRARVVVLRAPSGAALTVERPSGAVAIRAGSDLPEIRAGSTVSTDDRTVAVLEMPDGSRITLNRDTSVGFDAADENLLRVSRGEILADVVPRGAGRPRLRVEVPTGEVGVLGTKFWVSAGADESRVDVARGEVEVQCRDGGRARARAGEEATIPADGLPTVAAVRDLSEVLEWADEVDPGEKPPRGLGSLRAHPPGRPASERPLALESHKVAVRVQGPVARTEVEEVFRNDGNERLEGVYRFPLPPGASIARLALEVDGRLEEGAFVESGRAKRIWRGVIRQATPEELRRPREEYVWVPGPWRDPALLEWQKGNQFELRIFPIEARSSRRVVIAYTEVLRPVGSHRRYVYPLPFDEGGSTRAGTFTFEATLGGLDPASKVASLGYEISKGTDGDAKTVSFEARDFSPTGDLVIDFALPKRAAGLTAVAYRPESPPGEAGGGTAGSADAADGYVLLSIRPDLPVKGDPKPRDVLFVVDSSFSAFGDRWSAQVTLVRSMIEEMDHRDRFAVLACDVECRPIAGGFIEPSERRAEVAAERLGRIEPGDATDVVAAFEAAARELRGRGGDTSGREARIVYVGDGAASAGELDAGRVVEDSLAALDGLPVRVTTVGAGTETDELVLAGLARRGGGAYLAHTPGRSVRSQALAVLSAQYGAALEDARLALPDGFERIEPRELPAVRAGDELLVTARMRGRVEGEAVVKGKVAGQDYEQRYRIDIEATGARGNAFVPRLWAEARIASLTLSDPVANADEIVGLSKEHRVLSRLTSLLVLESEAMYRAFDVDRPDLVDDWTGEDSIREQSFGGDLEHQSAAGETSAGGALAGADSLDGIAQGGYRAAGTAAGPSPASPAREPPARPMAEIPARDDGETSARRGRGIRPGPPGHADEFGDSWNERGTWMRRTWERTADVRGASGPRQSDLRKVEQLTAALDEKPDSRDRHRALFLALSRVGDMEKALEVAEKWWARDRLDPEALERVADAEASLGHGDRALRLLGGIADVAPRDAAVHRRLAEAYEAAGLDARACAHRRAVAALEPDDADAASAAWRCLGGLGKEEAAEKTIERFGNDMTRARLRAKLAETPARPRELRGDLRVEASWDRSADLDVVLVHPDGRRSSWMGGVQGVSARYASDDGREELAFRRLQSGTYRIEIVRRDGSDDAGEIDGEVRVRAIGDSHGSTRLRFSLDDGESRTPIATVDVTRYEVLVPAGPPPEPRPLR